MLKTLIAILLRRPQDVASILSGFQKTVDRLTSLAAAEQAKASRLYDRAQQTRQEARRCEEECGKANAAAAKIAQLLG